jgi:predicted XRE-type DNA-binding protein
MTTVNSKSVRPGEAKEINGVQVEPGSGNVFRDLGLPNSRLRQAKARLAAEVNAIIDDFDWTQAEATRKLRTHQPIISALRRGRLEDISSERLLGWLGLLNKDIEIRVMPKKRSEPRILVSAVG